MIDEGRIGTIIVKDMSRLGRDYLQVGMYTEMVFPNNDIRFIAINNGVDSANQVDNDMTPFINIFNEFYAKDTSKKVKAVFRAKGNSGKPLTTNPPYGYLKDPNDKHHWIIDPEAAPVVREMFKMCVAGKGPSQISKELMRRGIPTPSEHMHTLGIKTPAKQSEQPGFWQQRTIADLLMKPEYLGHTVNFRTRRKSFKCKKTVWNDPSEWSIFENTHEPIIDQETFDIVQRIRDGRRRLTPIGEMPILSGMLFCADCGAKLYQARVSELEAAIAEAREQRLNVDSFLGMVRRYTDITELTAEIIRSFVEKIEVKKPEKVPGTRTKKQTLVIWWNFIGVVDIPQQEQKETA